MSRDVKRAWGGYAHREERRLRVRVASVATLLFLLSCAHGARNGAQPAVRRVVHEGVEIEVDTSIPDVLPFVEQLSSGDIAVYAVWTVPGEPSMRLAIAERPSKETSYGPQLIAVDTRRDVRVLHESQRLYDDDFIHPTFFVFPDRTLLLADHGSEDAHGVLAWSIENGRIRDLGELDVARPEDQDVFTRGAAPTARVELRTGKYVITIPGPLLLDPRGEHERLLAKEGEHVTFRESSGRFVLEQ